MNKRTDRARALRRARERAGKAAAGRQRSESRSGREVTLIELQNSTRLAEEIRRQIVRSYGGNASRAAAAVGMSQSTLTRLLHGSCRRVTLRTFGALYKLLPDNRAKWGSWVLPNESQLALAAYMLWLRSWFDRFHEEKGAGDAVTVGTSGLVWRGPADAWDVLVDRVRKVTPDVMDDLNALARDRRFFTDRLALALFRILEPLLDAHSSGGIERHFTELDDDELRKFVRAGFEREMILLLPRGGDIERAQAARPLSIEPATASISREIGRVLRSQEKGGAPRTMIEQAILAATPKARTEAAS